MYLTEEYIVNLELIYESEKQSIHHTEFIDEDGNTHSQPEVIISELIELDYIETEEDDDLYFLTTSGYYYIEEINGTQKRETYYRRDTQVDFTKSFNKLDAKNLKKHIFIWLIIFGLFITAYKYFYPSMFKNKKTQVELILTDEVIYELKKETEKKIDSLKKTKYKI